MRRTTASLSFFHYNSYKLHSASRITNHCRSAAPHLPNNHSGQCHHMLGWPECIYHRVDMGTREWCEMSDLTGNLLAWVWGCLVTRVWSTCRWRLDVDRKRRCRVGARVGPEWNYILQWCDTGRLLMLCGWSTDSLSSALCEFPDSTHWELYTQSKCLKFKCSLCKC